MRGSVYVCVCVCVGLCADESERVCGRVDSNQPPPATFIHSDDFIISCVKLTSVLELECSCVSVGLVHGGGVLG